MGKSRRARAFCKEEDAVSLTVNWQNPKPEEEEKFQGRRYRKVGV
jgi:hypothetical protein